jgi:hypothetical protein
MSKEGKDAKGQEGFLLIYPYPDIATRVPTSKIGPTGKPIMECKDNIVALRIYEYDENGKHKRNEKGGTIFKDYKIRHNDLKIKLLDGKFYETEQGNYIGY